VSSVFASNTSQWQDLFEKRAETLVKAITGASSVWVFSRLTSESGGQSIQTGAMSREVLPGMPSDDVAADMQAKAGPERPTKIGAVELYVVVPSSVGNERVALLRNRLPILLGMNLQGKDRLSIEQIPIAGPLEIVRQNLPFWIIPILLVFGALAFFALILSFVKPNIRLWTGGSVKAQIDQTSDVTSSEAPQDAEKPSKGNEKGTTAGSAEALAQISFSFINSSNLDNIIHLLTQEPPELVAYVVSHVSSSMGAAILGSLTSEKRQSVLKELASLKIHDPVVIKSLVERLSSKTQCVSGGTDRLGEIIQEMDDDAQESYLKLLEKTDPKAGAKIRHSLIKIEDVFKLEPGLFRQILGEAYRNGINLASFLRTRSAEEQQKALSCMPMTVRRIVEADLRADVPAAGEPERQAEAAKRLLRTAKKTLSPAPKSQHKVEEEIC
jgi:flagellar motor switch protein FliG